MLRYEGGQKRAIDGFAGHFRLAPSAGGRQAGVENGFKLQGHGLTVPGGNGPTQFCRQEALTVYIQS
jgi:hypothetical protein